MRRLVVSMILLASIASDAGCLELGQIEAHDEVTPCRGAGGTGACPAGTPAHEWQPGGPRVPATRDRPAVPYACPATLAAVIADANYCMSADDRGKFDHKGLCFREIPRGGSQSGHQCCYGDADTRFDSPNPATIYDNCTGTYDLVSPASARCGGRGAGALACRWAILRVPGHCNQDVTPWCDHAKVEAFCDHIEDGGAEDCTAGTEAACDAIEGCMWTPAFYCWPDVPDACVGGPNYDQACSPVATTNCYCTDRLNLLRRAPDEMSCGDTLGTESCPPEGCVDGVCGQVVCGDGVCDPTEVPPDAAAALAGIAPYCSFDCPVCGDYVCDVDAESPFSCPRDCDQAQQYSYSFFFPPLQQTTR